MSRTSSASVSKGDRDVTVHARSMHIALRVMFIACSTTAHLSLPIYSIDAIPSHLLEEERAPSSQSRLVDAFTVDNRIS